ncbi:MAG: TlpA family protein disulfide reductase [Deltaproteobacteria bacterium]|nr:TlpA family protein disulfide reductase [Deltaproteobacteria bacterium]
MKTKSVAILILASVLVMAILCPLSAANNPSHFLLKDMRGEAYDSRRVLGKKPLLIVFSTTWCPSCNKLLPEFRRIHRQYTPKGLEMISINIGESNKKVAAWLFKNQVPYRVLVDETGAVGTAYQVMGVPSMVLINKEGKVVCNPCTSLKPIDDLLK